MTLVDIDDFLPDVMLFAPKAPSVVAHRFIREAARKLCERGALWTAVDQFEVVSPEYESITNFSDAEIVKIEEAEFEGEKLEPKTRAWLDDHHPGWETIADDGTSPRYCTQVAYNSVTVFPKAEGTLRLRMHLKPSVWAETMPQFLLSQFGTEIGRGASAELLMLPEQPFTNPQLGLDHRAQFQSALDRVGVKAAKGQQDARLRTRARFF